MNHSHLDNLRLSLPSRVVNNLFADRIYENPKHADHTPLRITGGIGDLILGIGAAEVLNEQVGDVIIYSKWPEIGEIFTSIPNRHEAPLIENGLDFIINLNAVCKFQFARNFTGFRNSALVDIYVKNVAFSARENWKQIVDHHPRLDHLMARIAVKEGLTRYDVTYLSLGVEPRMFRKKLNCRHPFDGKPYITVHDGFDINNKQWGTKRATKTWSITHWKSFVQLVKKQYPGLTVVQLGGPTSRRILGVDVDRVGMLTFHQSLGVLQHSLCHFDGDSGLTHAAHVLGTPSVALYGPTPKDFFGYADNVNIDSDACSPCWWLLETWVADCAMGFEVPECMDSIFPQEVLDKSRVILDGALDGQTMGHLRV